MPDDTRIHTYFHCRACVMGQQTPRLEAGVSTTGIVVQCKKHGLVGHFDPTKLAAVIMAGPMCECCPGGRHIN